MASRPKGGAAQRLTASDGPAARCERLIKTRLNPVRREATRGAGAGLPRAGGALAQRLPRAGCSSLRGDEACSTGRSRLPQPQGREVLQAGPQSRPHAAQMHDAAQDADQACPLQVCCNHKSGA